MKITVVLRLFRRKRSVPEGIVAVPIEEEELEYAVETHTDVRGAGPILTSCGARETMTPPRSATCLVSAGFPAAVVSDAGPFMQSHSSRRRGEDVPPSTRKELKVNPDLSAFGRVADADRSAESEWDSVWSALHAYGERPLLPSLESDGWRAVPTVEQHVIPVGA